jgi:hypothetical protein
MSFHNVVEDVVHAKKGNNLVSKLKKRGSQWWCGQKGQGKQSTPLYINKSNSMNTT